MGNFGRSFLILILLLGTGAVGFFYARPAWQEFQVLQKKLERLEQLSAELDDLIANKDALFEKIGSISKADLKKIDAIVPKGPKAADFLVSLEAIALKNSVILKEVSLQTHVVTAGAGIAASSGEPRPTGRTALTPAQNQGLQQLTYLLTVSAPYEKLKDFLKDLEKNLRLTDIKLMSLNVDVLKSATDMFEAEMTVVTYYYQ